MVRQVLAVDEEAPTPVHRLAYACAEDPAHAPPPTLDDRGGRIVEACVESKLYAFVLNRCVDLHAIVGDALVDHTGYGGGAAGSSSSTRARTRS